MTRADIAASGSRSGTSNRKASRSGTKAPSEKSAQGPIELGRTEPIDASRPIVRPASPPISHGDDEGHEARPARTIGGAPPKRSAGKSAASGTPVDPATRLIELAEIARPHGVRGELKLKLYNSDSDLLCHVPEVIVEYADGERAIVAVKSARPIPEGILVFLEGCASREGADDLRGAKILVPRNVFPPLEDGEFYACDIEGARVVDPEGDLGVVERMISYPTCDALVVRDGGKTVEIPLVDGVVDEVDVAAKVVRLVARGAFIPE